MAASLPTAGRPAVLATPNVTPMIDVMLVLLIIFMLVTPALGGAVVTLPEGMHAVPKPEEVKDRTLTIDATGAYALDGSTIAAAELPERLAAYVRMYPTDRVLYVRADQALEYGVVSEAMDVARASGIVAVGMVTEARRAPARRRATSP
jgi:biopolymer transport protein TolR